MKKSLKVVKIGGNIVDNPEALGRFLHHFARLDGLKLLIHGGGKVATTLSKELGVETKMVEGRRVTDYETLRIVTMVYGGLINKTIVAGLQAEGCNALGLCGADGSLVQARRRDAAPVDYGFVGDPTGVSAVTARALLDAELVPVVAPLTHDGAGNLLNTNADTMAQTVATGLSGLYRVELIYCFEKPGVLRDVDDDGSVIPRITPASYAELRGAGVVADGMIPKLDNAFRAIDRGVASVVICHADHLLTPGYGGTTIARE